MHRFAYPMVREQWFAFHEKSLVQLTQQWLDDEEIEADLKFSARGEP
jgi:hypothetical protein